MIEAAFSEPVIGDLGLRVKQEHPPHSVCVVFAMMGCQFVMSGWKVIYVSRVGKTYGDYRMTNCPFVEKPYSLVCETKSGTGA